MLQCLWDKVLADYVWCVSFDFNHSNIEIMSTMMKYLLEIDFVMLVDVNDSLLSPYFL